MHLQVYGQSAPKEDAEIVTFRLQAEIEVPRLELPTLARGDGRAERALKGERPLFDIDANRFVRAKVYDRQKLMAGDRIAGPGDHRPVRRHDRGARRADRDRRRHRHPDHRDRRAPMTSNATTVDPVTTEVVASRLRETAATMEYALYHSGYSPILRESKDGTAGLTDPEGRVVIISGGLQYHFTAYQQAVQAVLARYPAADLKPGESFISNDPYKCGSPHAPDFVAVTPAFHEGVLLGFGVSLAHKSDIGGLVPGSSGAAAREIYHDGLLLPPVRFQTAAGIEEAIEAIIANNSRVAEVVLGDLRAQVGCTRLGVERLAALCEEYGRDDRARGDGEPHGVDGAPRRRRAAGVARWQRRGRGLPRS